MSHAIRGILLRDRDPRDEREIVTPEGVPLRFHVAEIGDRVLATLVDALWMVIPSSLLMLGCALTLGSYGASIGVSLVILGINVYFIWFEGRRQGQTPGKRRARIRVIDRHGGPLTPGAVLARNLTRNFELLLPLAVLLSMSSRGGAEGAAQLLAGAWVLLFLVLPLFTRDRLRVGDMIAGTLVVLPPRESLLADIGERAARAAARRERHVFTTAQLEIYGAYELQVLEKVLRSTTVNRSDAMTTVAREIRRKIDFEVPAGGTLDAPRFLQDFYAAQRQHLEQRLLLGERRERKRRQKARPDAPEDRGDRL